MDLQMNKPTGLSVEINENNKRDVAAGIIEAFEDFLIDKNIKIENKEKDDFDDSIIYGSDYYSIEDSIFSTFDNEAAAQRKRKQQEEREKQDEENAKRDMKIAKTATNVAVAVLGAEVAAASTIGLAAAVSYERLAQMLGNVLYEVAGKTGMDHDTYLSWLETEVGFTPEEISAFASEGILHDDLAVEDPELG